MVKVQERPSVTYAIAVRPRYSNKFNERASKGRFHFPPGGWYGPATMHRLRGVKWTFVIGVRLVGNVETRSDLEEEG